MRNLARTCNRIGIAAILALFALVLAGGAAGKALPAPVPTTPGNGVVVDGMPAFGWNPVAAAEEYEFQIAADRSFSSPVFGRGKDDFRTKNTRATLTLTPPDGTYWWRVRAFGRDKKASSWSGPRSFSKRWSARPVALSPANGAAVVYPSTPLKLSWSPVPGARKYLVSIGTDADVSSLVTVNGSSNPVETTATTLTPVATLSPNEDYWWRVTPVDAEGNHGTPSCLRHNDPNPCPSFVWSWPSQTTLTVTDLVPDTELYDPQFSWLPVPGAARYEVDINSSRDFAASSKVCCSGTTINTYLSPLMVFKSNTYYWRVRALDMDGHAGVWNCYEDPSPACQNLGSFIKTFDNVPPVSPTSIAHLRMRDNLEDPGIDADAGTTGYQTEVPIVTWDPVPGAASYQVDVTLFDSDLHSCLWSLSSFQGHYTSTTAVTEWTPLGLTSAKPYPDPHPVAVDLPPLKKGRHCVRVRARSDRAIGDDVYGDYTYLDCSATSCQGTRDDQGWAFDWSGYPTDSACAPSCPGYLGSSDYVTPVAGTLSRSTPYFTWKPLPWPAITLKNTTGLDALTLKPLDDYTFRATVRDDAADPSMDQLLLSGLCTGLFSYPDGDLTNLKRQINQNSSCASASGPYAAGPLAYVTDVQLSAGFRSYFVIVARDPNFTNIVDYAFTHVPAYAPRGNLGPTTYPDETLETLDYWAVLPEAGWNGVGGAGDPLLANASNFHKRSLPPDRKDPGLGYSFSNQPRFQWSPVLGARTYRLQISQDQSFANPLEDVVTDSTGYASNTTYPADTLLYWRVRANDENGLGLTWSNADAPAWTFQKTLDTPAPNCSPQPGDAIPTWTWSVVPNAVSYDVSIDLPDGTHKDLTGYRSPAMAPTVMFGTGVFHWRVRANFPHSPYGLTPGPYSQTCAFTRTIHAPLHPSTAPGTDHILLSWDAKPGAKQYRVQISGTPDFGQLAENVLTDNTSYAPLLEYFGFPTLDTGRLYWRVAAVDEGGNVGDFTDPQLISRTRRMEIAISGNLKRGKRSPITIMVTNFETHGGVAKALVRASGAGLRRRLRTDGFGNVRVTFRPRRGTLVISATKRGYRSASTSLRVR